MLAVGIDMIEVERVRRSIERFGSRFLERVFTEREILYCGGRPERLAARFAAKEAVGKALGTGIGDVRWLEIEIVNEESGRPILVLYGAAQEIAEASGIGTWAVSLSHTDSHAIGMVVAIPQT
jgi:holo-[acyl-carrier protein] synthase